ncbi:type II toxin-antitoxin system VapC family toxin [Rhodoferax sp.]|uniref:PIN domain-containing protein n=1 Tax=Rhodoferax sp. TaxID=50421 RepID=UPI00283FF003|nr:type II toxin-antitoxin system VapC family toxin [Rhodoferax sp.]MDR3369213.1 type II toxin-antitoxin system VapC family toxin [Rhodoferax sp.]
MAALDTNVLVRFLVQDDAKQGLLARELIRSILAKGEPLFVPVTVMLELEWVLRSNFGFDKAQIILTLSNLLAAAELSFESETAVDVAVELFRQNKADFSDCVHVALCHAAGMTPMWTFDRAASKVDGAQLLSA